MIEAGKVDRIIDVVQQETAGESIEDAMLVLAAVVAAALIMFAKLTNTKPRTVAKCFVEDLSHAISVIENMPEPTMQ